MKSIGCWRNLGGFNFFMAKPLENQPKVTMKIDLKDLTLKKPYSIDHIDSVPGTESI